MPAVAVRVRVLPFRWEWPIILLGMMLFVWLRLGQELEMDKNHLLADARCPTAGAITTTTITTTITLGPACLAAPTGSSSSSSAAAAIAGAIAGAADPAVAAAVIAGAPDPAAAAAAMVLRARAPLPPPQAAGRAWDQPLVDLPRVDEWLLQRWADAQGERLGFAHHFVVPVYRVWRWAWESPIEHVRRLMNRE